jgi:hypothetical protein
MKRTFYGIVVEQDTPKDRRRPSDDPPRGPLLMECYLGPETISPDRAKVEAFARTHGFDRYGWVAIAEITVDIPDAPAAVPAEAASVHA